MSCMSLVPVALCVWVGGYMLVKCPKCDGKGCDECNGTGEIETD